MGDFEGNLQSMRRCESGVTIHRAQSYFAPADGLISQDRSCGLFVCD
jgi:hypothetical protein